jgi:hypothetical protein
VTAAVAFGSPSPRTPDPIGSAGPTPTVSPTPTADLTPTATPTVGPSTAPTCRTSDFTVKSYGGDGYAGGETDGIALTNTGSVACELIGFAEVTFVDGSRQPLPTTIVHFGTEIRFVVPPGELAYFEVSIGHANVGDEGAPCDHRRRGC